MEGKKILVVEDDLTWHELLLSVLKDNDLEYDAFVRVYAEGDDFVFMDIDSRKHSVDLSNYWLALVDGRLKGSTPQGIDLARALPKKGLPVIATSGSRYLNEDMVRAGALTGIPKDQLFTGLHKHQLNLVQIVTSARKAS
jgi:hypothetical protein